MLFEMFSRIVILLFVLLSILGCKKTNRDLLDNDQNVRRISHSGITREYILYIPAAYDGKTAVPLLFSFHGYAGTASWFMEEADMRALAEAENFILVYPQGTRNQGANPLSNHWNAGLPSEENKSDADDLGFIETLISELRLDYNIDSKRVYACGYSNGGMMSYALACYKSDLFAAVGSVSGTMLPETMDQCSPSHPTPIIIIHGTSDGVLPYTGGEGTTPVEEILTYWNDFNNTDTTAKVEEENNIEHFIYSGGDNGVSVAHYKVNNGGHEWFDLNYKGKSTEMLIWDFMSKYDKDGFRN